jgi:hypothetical protein
MVTNHNKLAESSPSGVLRDDDVEYYRTPRGVLVSVLNEDFFSVEGLRKHLPVSLSASMSFCCQQRDALGIAEDGPELIQPLLKIGACTPASDVHYPCLLAQWIGEAWLSTHLVALFLDVAHRVLSPLPENEVDAYFPFDRVGRAVEEFDRQEATVREVLRQMLSEADEDSAPLAARN